MLSTGDNEAATNSAKVVATVTDLGTNNTLDIQFTEPLALVEGNNWLRVRYDTKEDAEADTKLDAALTTLDFGAAKQNITDGDPTGERVIKNIVVFHNGENATKVIAMVVR